MRRLAAVVLLLAACGNECDEDACELARRPVVAREIEQGIAGVIRHMNDYTSPGECSPCSDGETLLKVWAVDREFTAEADVVMAAAVAPSAMIAARRRYEHALATGSHVVCAENPYRRRACAVLSVAARQVFTVNVVDGQVGPAIAVIPPGERVPRATGTFQFRIERFDAAMDHPPAR